MEHLGRAGMGMLLQCQAALARRAWCCDLPRSTSGRVPLGLRGTENWAALFLRFRGPGSEHKKHYRTLAEGMRGGRLGGYLAPKGCLGEGAKSPGVRLLDVFIARHAGPGARPSSGG